MQRAIRRTASEEKDEGVPQSTTPSRMSPVQRKESRKHHPKHVGISRTKQSLIFLTVGVLVGYMLLPMVLVELDLDYLGDFQEINIDRNEPSGALGGALPNLRPVEQPNTRTLNNDVPVSSDIEKRIAEETDLLSKQSIPTSTTPYIMKTPKLPDHHRKKILVTGGAGFVGSHLVDKLMMEGHEVIVVDNFFTGQKKNIAHWLHHPNFSLVNHDVTEPLTLEVDQIYHLACPASPPHYQYNPVKTIKTSTMGTLNMLGLAKRVRARILLTSTSEIYGDPKGRFPKSVSTLRLFFVILSLTPTLFG